MRPWIGEGRASPRGARGGGDSSATRGTFPSLLPRPFARAPGASRPADVLYRRASLRRLLPRELAEIGGERARETGPGRSLLICRPSTHVSKLVAPLVPPLPFPPPLPRPRARTRAPISARRSPPWRPRPTPGARWAWRPIPRSSSTASPPPTSCLSAASPCSDLPPRWWASC